MRLPKVPEGYRLNILPGPWNSAKVKLQKKVWWGWQTVDHSLCVPSDIATAAGQLIKDQAKRQREADILRTMEGIHE